MVSSGNSLDYTEQDMTFMLSNKVAVKEMEAAAVAWVASMFQAPMFCLKSITDIVDGMSCYHYALQKHTCVLTAVLQAVGSSGFNSMFISMHCACGSKGMLMSLCCLAFL